MTIIRKKATADAAADKELGNGLKPERKEDRPFSKVNFYMMAACLVLIVLGFLLMSGGGASEAGEFNPDIFSTRRIVVGPTLAFLGFLFMAFAIIWNPAAKNKINKNADKESDTDAK